MYILIYIISYINAFFHYIHIIIINQIQSKRQRGAFDGSRIFERRSRRCTVSPPARTLTGFAWDAYLWFRV